MLRSFIRPRPKRLLSWEIKILLLFFGLILALLLMTYGYLRIRMYLYASDAQEAITRVTQLDSARTAMQHQVDFIKKEALQAKDIYTNNELLGQSIKNLFDIVPDKITLNKAFLDKNSLTLYGKTPSKETYQFMLLAPLRSIFDRSYTTYYQLPNGWFNFESTNYIDTVKEVTP
ncbi:MAG: hypothetical protein KU28_01615 [Sulfurovum sp. PC08-66]|nr:MAG: hypothetical protein KU28_01615 [Sulfurovum sp. PC08-66]KIM12635.1 MAG: hypothetical protein KU37_01720 [Sulfuricurvum sp. PC08-66]